MSDITLEKNWYDNELLCPVCNGNNLHHEAVIVYDRREDGEQVRVTHVTGSNFSSVVVPSETAENPSSRRGALAVTFWCENCHGELNGNPADYTKLFKLQIQQHKGTTYFDWNIPEN